MQNYHSHKSFSNMNTPFKDSAMSYEDYAKRAVELGQQVITSVDHGTQGNYLRCWQAAQKHGLKFVYGVEAYWVRDRKLYDDVDKKGKTVQRGDSINAHIVILAQNMQGIYQINEMLSTANEDGFYKVPRVDMELLKKLNPKDVFVTTACVGFWAKIDKSTQDLIWNYSAEDENTPDSILSIFAELKNHFGPSLFLEVQYHDTKWQKDLNRLILQVHYDYGVPLIAGLDSHYIYPHQKEERKWLREESGVRMDDEDHEFSDGVFEDYPDEETVIDRFRKQGVLNEEEIAEAIDNTDILLFFDDIVFDQSRKLPTIYPNLTQEERNQVYLDRVWGAWNANKENILSNARYLYNEYINLYGMEPDELNYPTEELYEEAIRYETEIVTSTGVADYFLLDSEMIRLGVEKGGFVTPTGRGSASSFFTNTLLGLSTIDRLSLPVKLYPERFVTKDRLMSSLPDIDMNVSDQKPFAEAQDELLTAACGTPGHSYPMIAHGTLKYKSAFKLYARAMNMPAEEANMVSKQIENYERAIKEAEDDDERELIQISDFVDKEYMKYIEGSEPYRGIVVSKSQAPCAFLIYNGDIRSEIGIMRVNANGGKKVVYCTVIDGYTAEEFGYVKNDILIVKVIAINAEAMKRAGTPQYSSQDVIRMTLRDNLTWDIFSKGWSQGINQCQGAGTTSKLMTYKPSQLRDLSAFVAAIRPGFKSQLNKFLHREKFSYGVPAFDKILRNDSSESAWMLYQENSMTALSLAGFDMPRTYPIIKAISKKKTKVINGAHDEFSEGFVDYLSNQQGIPKSSAQDQKDMVWNVIRDSASYSFNASHAVCVSLDALYGAYLKAHYPMEYYSTLLDSYANDGNKDKVSLIKAEMKKAFGITVVPARFRQDNRGFFADKQKMQIADALHSVKHIGRPVADELYEMRNNQYDSFVDLLCDLDSRKPFNSKSIQILIKMGYFEEFGKRRKLLNIYQEFSSGKNRITKQLKDASREKRLIALKEFEASSPEQDITIEEQMVFEVEHYGTPITIIREAKGKYIALEVETKYSPKIKLYSIATGNADYVKILKKDFKESPIETGDIVTIKHHNRKQACSFVDGKRVPRKGIYEIWVDCYDVQAMHMNQKPEKKEKEDAA